MFHLRNVLKENIMDCLRLVWVAFWKDPKHVIPSSIHPVKQPSSRHLRSPQPSVKHGCWADWDDVYCSAFIRLVQLRTVGHRNESAECLLAQLTVLGSLGSTGAGATGVPGHWSYHHPAAGCMRRSWSLRTLGAHRAMLSSPAKARFVLQKHRKWMVLIGIEFWHVVYTEFTHKQEVPPSAQIGVHPYFKTEEENTCRHLSPKPKF